jgi:paraquat-inducible protein A
LSLPRPALLGCPQCDLLQRPIALAAGQSALCGRCGATLYRAHPPGRHRALAFTLAGLIAFGVAVAFPIVGLEIGGTVVQATLADAAQALYLDDMAPLAALVAATTLLFPFAVLTTMALILLRKHPGNGHASALLRTLRAAQPWSMVEVFVLGVLVALAKLMHMAGVAPGVGAWGLGALVVLLAAAHRAADYEALA